MMTAQQFTVGRSEDRIELRLMLGGHAFGFVVQWQHAAAVAEMFEDAARRVRKVAAEVVEVRAVQLVRGDRLVDPNLGAIYHVSVDLSRERVVVDARERAEFALTDEVLVWSDRPEPVPLDDPFGLPNTTLTARQLAEWGQP